MKIYVDCYGCEQRKLDAQRIIEFFKANEGSVVTSPNTCDYAIVVTCAVDSASERVSLARIEECVGKMPQTARLIITGCLPSISPQMLRNYPVTQTLSPRLLSVLDSLFQDGPRVPMKEIQDPNKSVFDSPPPAISVNKSAAREEYDIAKSGFKIRIGHGCLGQCSYCMIRRATGSVSSVPFDEVVRQVEKAASRGEPTVMLLAGDTGAYGEDCGTSFYALLERLAMTAGDVRIIIHDFNPQWLIKDLSEYLRVFRNFRKNQAIWGFNSPVQSGSDKILRLMRRSYTGKEAAAAFKSVRQAAPSMKMGTHVMVGFPGEEESDFEATTMFLEDVQFDFVTCFPYSENLRADSACLLPKVQRSLTTRRVEWLTERLTDKVKVIW